MVTPFRFRAVTSSPRGKCRSIFFTGGVVSIFLRADFSGSSSADGDLLIRLQGHPSVNAHLTGAPAGDGWEWEMRVIGGRCFIPVQLLCLLCNEQFYLILLWYHRMSRQLLGSRRRRPAPAPREPVGMEISSGEERTQIIDVEHAGSTRAGSPMLSTFFGRAG